MSDWSKEVILTSQDEINLAQKSFDSRIRGKPKSFLTDFKQQLILGLHPLKGTHGPL